jgi:hypothetical protein
LAKRAEGNSFVLRVEAQEKIDILGRNLLGEVKNDEQR